MKKKHWKVTVFDKTSETVRDDTLYTTDTEVYLVFELMDKNFKPDSVMVTIYNIYGTATINESVDIVGGIVNYEMPEEAIGHQGGWRAQLVFTKDNEDYTTTVIEFDVDGHLLDNNKPTIVYIENWNSFIKHGENLVDDWEQLEKIRQVNERQRELAESVRRNTFEINESARQANEQGRVSAESVRVANEVERISKDSERDSKIDSKANKQQEEWIRPTILNGWRDHLESSAYPPTSFMKDEFGFVHIRGHMSGGEDNDMFILPEGYRPSHHMYFAVVNNHTSANHFTGLVVRSNGRVSVQTMDTPLRPSLNVSFKAVES